MAVYQKKALTAMQPGDMPGTISCTPVPPRLTYTTLPKFSYTKSTMSQPGKLQKFAELATLPGVIEKPQPQAGLWAKHFGNHHPITLELGCGYGEYTIALAQRYPHQNFIGIDIQGERLWKAAKTAAQLQLSNVRWLRMQIEQLLDHFAAQEINEIWLTFPDPFPRRSQIKKRLVAPRFLSMYQTMLQPHGRMHLKTDAANLITYAHETIAASGGTIEHELFNFPPATTDFDLDIMTRFERKHRQLAQPIYYLSWHW